MHCFLVNLLDTSAPTEHTLLRRLISLLRMTLSNAPLSCWRMVLDSHWRTPKSWLIIWRTDWIVTFGFLTISEVSPVDALWPGVWCDTLTGRPFFEVDSMNISGPPGPKMSSYDWIKRILKTIPRIPAFIHSRPRIVDARLAKVSCISLSSTFPNVWLWGNI